MTVVNVLGDFDIADDKLAFIDGDGASDQITRVLIGVANDCSPSS